MSYNLINIEAEIFSDVADRYAEKIFHSGLNKHGKQLKCNKSTQLRKFYEEVCLWQEKIDYDEAKFKECLPYIKMLNAKVAYAKGRELVSEEFESMIRDGIKQVNDLTTFHNFKTFFEAFMGFYKSYAK